MILASLSDVATELVDGSTLADVMARTSSASAVLPERSYAMAVT